MKKLLLLFTSMIILNFTSCGLVDENTAQFQNSIVTASAVDKTEYNYTVQDIRNLQDFLLAKPTVENLTGKPYDMNGDNRWNVFDLCLMKQKLFSESEKTTMKLDIETNGTHLTAELADNSSAQALVELLKQGDISINMHDYANFEKVGSLPESLPRNDEQISTDYGDIILYQGNQFVIYYDKNSWNFTKLGHINNITQEELKVILGDGNVTVTLSLK